MRSLLEAALVCIRLLLIILPYSGSRSAGSWKHEGARGREHRAFHAMECNRRGLSRARPAWSLCTGSHLCSCNVGDKPSSFVGSKQWIGAIELGYILDTLLGVSSKVITVSSGSDMPSKAREIAHHFDTQVCHPLTPIREGL